MYKVKVHENIFSSYPSFRRGIVVVKKMQNQGTSDELEEIRKHRKEHTIKFRGELSEICKDLRRIQEASGFHVVHFEARKLKPNARSSRRDKLKKHA